MNSQDLKNIIKAIVQEEVKKQLPSMITQVLSEALTGNKSPVVKRQVISTPPVVVKPKEQKQYVKNPLLNEILNNTTVRIKQENTPFVGYSETFAPGSSEDINIIDNNQSEEENIDYGSLNESHVNQIPVVSNITPTTQEQAKVLSKINRDFRSIMKTVDEKRKNGGFSSGAVSLEQ